MHPYTGIPHVQPNDDHDSFGQRFLAGISGRHTLVTNCKYVNILQLHLLMGWGGCQVCFHTYIICIFWVRDGAIFIISIVFFFGGGGICHVPCQKDFPKRQNQSITISCAFSAWEAAWSTWLEKETKTWETSNEFQVSNVQNPYLDVPGS